MTIEINKEDILETVRLSVKERLSDYSIKKVVDQMIDSEVDAMKPMLISIFESLNGDADFKKELQEQVRSKLVRRGTELAGGMIDKAFDKLKQQPLFNDKLKIKVHEVVQEFIAFK